VTFAQTIGDAYSGPSSSLGFAIGGRRWGKVSLGVGWSVALIGIAAILRRPDDCELDQGRCLACRGAMSERNAGVTGRFRFFPRGPRARRCALG